MTTESFMEYEKYLKIGKIIEFQIIFKLTKLKNFNLQVILIVIDQNRILSKNRIRQNNFKYISKK